jgi:hypothetical protein
VSPQSSLQLSGFANIERAAPFIAENVHARRPRRPGADAITDTTPRILAIFDHQRLRDQAAGNLRGRIPDYQDVGGELLMIGLAAHLGEAGAKSISEKHATTCGIRWKRGQFAVTLAMTQRSAVRSRSIVHERRST